jgi:hypothetical protein
MRSGHFLPVWKMNNYFRPGRTRLNLHSAVEVTHPRAHSRAHDCSVANWGVPNLALVLGIATKSSRRPLMVFHAKRQDRFRRSAARVQPRLPVAQFRRGIRKCDPDSLAARMHCASVFISLIVFRSHGFPANPAHLGRAYQHHWGWPFLTSQKTFCPLTQRVSLWKRLT